MKVVVGLGNPGSEYENTRHNVGFVVVDELKKRLQGDGVEFKKNMKFNAEICEVGSVMFVKPLTFMNLSGEAVAKIVSYYKVETDDLWVVHDDLDMKIGEHKIQLGKGPKVHGGVNSVVERVGSDEFWRVRVGTDSRVRDGIKIPGEKYVLMKLDVEDGKNLDEAVERVVAELVDLVGKWI